LERKKARLFKRWNFNRFFFQNLESAYAEIEKRPFAAGEC